MYGWLARFVCVVVLGLALAPGLAFAACTVISPSETQCDTNQEAYAAVQAHPPEQAWLDSWFGEGGRPARGIIKHFPSPSNAYSWQSISKTGQPMPGTGYHNATYGSISCPADNAQTIYGSIKYPTTAPFPNGACFGGCAYYPADGDGGSDGKGTSAFFGSFKSALTYGACGDNPSNPTSRVMTPGVGNTPESDTCAKVGNLTQCYDPVSKKHCATSSKGNKYCWTDSEIGTKAASDQLEAITRTAAGNPPPTPAPPPGLTNAEVNPVTSGGLPYPNAPPSQTTNNYVIANPTGVVGLPDAESGGSEAGDDDDNVAGGGSCAGPYTCSGDAILCAQLEEQRATRCALEELEMGSAESGTWEEFVDPGTGEFATADASLETDNTSLVTEQEVDFSLLDDSGFLGGARECPMVPTIAFGEYSVAMPVDLVCTTLEILAAIILLAGTLHAFYIVGGSR